MVKQLLLGLYVEIFVLKITLQGEWKMTAQSKLNTKEVYEENGVIGEYTLGFTADGITPQDYMEKFLGGNIESGTITEHEIHLINKQGEKITIEISGFGLNKIEHLDDDLNEGETYHPNEG